MTSGHSISCHMYPLSISVYFILYGPMSSMSLFYHIDALARTYIDEPGVGEDKICKVCPIYIKVGWAYLLLNLLTMNMMMRNEQHQLAPTKLKQHGFVFLPYPQNIQYNGHLPI